MKKFLSILCVMAMMLSFAAFSANAADNEFVLSIKSQDAETTVFSLSMNTTHTVSAFSVYIDVTEAADAGASFTATKIAANKAQYNKANKVVLVTYAPTDGGTLEGNVELATFTISAINENYAISKKVDTDRLKFKVSAKDPEGGPDIEVTTDFGFSPESLTVTPFSVGGEDKGYVDLTATVTAATGWTVDGKETDWEAGTGFKAAFEVPAVLDTMKWSATIDGEKMYSKVPYDLKGFEGIEVGSSVVLYGAFTNGARENNEFGKTVAIKDVTGAGIILKDADGVFYASEGAIAE